MSNIKPHETSINENNNLIKWINDNGGFIHHHLYIDTKIIENKIHRSIYYKNEKEIEQNSTIAKIPYNLIISENTFKEIPNINKWTDIIEISSNPTFKTKFKSSKFKIMLALIYEATKKENSFFYPYIKLLPNFDSFDNHPINIYNKDNNAFKTLESIAENFINKISSLSIELNILREMILLCNNKFQLFDDNIYTHTQLEKLIKWAFFIHKTRSWGDGLMPFNDIFNHAINSRISLKHVTHDNIEDGEYYIFKADSQFNNTENSYEIFDHYGYYDSMTLFISYNFVPKNDIHYLLLPFKFNTKDAFENLKIQEINKCKFNNHKIFLGNNGPSKDLFTILRILSLTQKEYNIFSKIENLHKYENIINYENELKSVKFLLKLILDLKKSTYKIENLNHIFTILNNFKNKELST